MLSVKKLKLITFFLTFPFNPQNRLNRVRELESQYELQIMSMHSEVRLCGLESWLSFLLAL
jgi:hypothetical protein